MPPGGGKGIPIGGAALLGDPEGGKGGKGAIPRPLGAGGLFVSGLWGEEEVEGKRGGLTRHESWWGGTLRGAWHAEGGGWHAAWDIC